MEDQEARLKILGEDDIEGVKEIKISPDRWVKRK
jgi:hypothetical protein